MMWSSKKHLYILLLLTISSISLPSFCQTTAYSYEKLWGFIESESISRDQRLKYLEQYIQKAQKKRDIIQEFKGLNEKRFYLANDAALNTADQMYLLAVSSKNDSLISKALSTKAVLYYANRNFKEALKYAIKAEQHISAINNPYLLNATHIDIGNIYYHSRHYKKAKEYFLKAKKYYNSKKEYNDLRSYALTLYSLNKVYWQLNEIDSLQIGIHTAEAILPQLRSEDRLLETAYVNYAKGGSNYLSQNYTQAGRYFLQALPIIKENEDFTNEYVIYLYLGKIAWQQNDKQKAIEYFGQIKNLFEQKKFLNYELREAYDYLILYYKDTKQPQKQLEATEQLIALNRQFEKEQQLLTNTLHYELETKKLEESRTSLEKQMSSSKNTYSILLMVAGILCVIFLGYSIWRSKEHKKMRLRFNELLKTQTEDRIYSLTPKVSHIGTFSVSNSNTIIPLNENAIKLTEAEEIKIHEEITVNEVVRNYVPKIKEDLSSTELRLLEALDDFEKEKGFMNRVKLDDLALTFNTNRSTLSALMNKHKGSFATYLNKLRIKQVMLDLRYQPQLRKLSMQGLAETYGFNNGRTFSAQFKSETGLTPSYFIEQLIIDERKVQKKEK